MLRRLGLLLLMITWVLGLTAPQALAAATVDDPAVAAGRIRTALLAGGGAARPIYSETLESVVAAHAPKLHTRIAEGLARVEEAKDPTALADARAQVWTGLLGAGHAVVRSALQSGDSATARTWLRLREFRAPTRFSRPSADATQAVERFAAGEVEAGDAILSVDADLLDTYQERLRLALQDLQEAEAKGYASRTAEYASLAEGYFLLLAPSYGDQKGDEALGEALAAFAALREAARLSQPTTAALAGADAVLKGFRAAPLGPEEQARRAGQLRRFLGLVPVEYGRGVAGGKVTKDFEIQEAITFRDGAAAAFADLTTLLEARDPAATSDVSRQLDDLRHHLANAASGAAVASPDEIEATAKEVDQLLLKLMPEDWLKRNTAGDFDTVSQLLDQMERAAAAGQYPLAESARLEAYAVMETGPEPRLVAFAPQFIPRLESLFWHGSSGHEGLARLIADHAPLVAIKETRTRLDAELSAAKEALAGNTSPVAVATNAGLIVFREGLEAVLILASLMAGFRRPELHKLRKPLWWGACLSLIATALTWVLAQGLLVALARYGERLEAIVSVIAVAVLLLITNWFFHKSYWTDWLAGFHAKKKGLAGGGMGQWIGLATLGFTSIYREGFETVLFLQALVLDAGSATVLGGVSLGMVGVAVVGVLLFQLQMKLPYKKMLIVTGIFIGSVLLTMVGKMIHSFQVIGWLPTHPVRTLDLPYWTGAWFGIFGTWEGLSLQVAAAVFVIGSYYLAEWMQRRGSAEANETALS